MRRRNDFRNADGKHCPTCGHAIDTSGILFDRDQFIVVYRGKIADLGNSQRSTIFRILFDAYPQPVHHDTLMLSVYPNGEPEFSSTKSLDVAMHRARQRLKPLGILISRANGDGFRRLFIEPAT